MPSSSAMRSGVVLPVPKPLFAARWSCTHVPSSGWVTEGTVPCSLTYATSFQYFSIHRSSSTSHIHTISP